MYDRYCSECGHRFQGALSSTPCPQCGGLTFILPFRMQVSIPTGETKTKAKNEVEAEEYLDSEYKQNREEEIAIAKDDEHWQREFHRAEFPHRIARDLGGGEDAA